MNNNSSSFVLSLLVISCVALFVSCTKDASRALDFQSTDSTIPVGDALQTLSQFIQNTGTRAESRQVQSVDLTRDGDGYPLAYLVNFSSGKGFAVLAADSRIDSIVAVTDSGSADWESIMNAGSKRLDNTSPDFPETLIAKLIKNGISIPQDRGGGGQAGGGLDIGDGDDPGGSFINTYVAPLTINYPYHQHRTYCHKENGGYVVCGCASTAMAIISSYHQFPPLIIDEEVLDYSSCNSNDGSGLKFVFTTDGRQREVFFPVQDYFNDYALIPVSLLSDTGKTSLIKKIDANICNVHGTPTSIETSAEFTRSRYKLNSAIYSMLSCAIESWAATAVMPGAVDDGLENLGYLNVDYRTRSNVNDHLDSLRFMLEQNRPVIMGGWSLSELNNSHYWVVDGINMTASSCLIHCNWGWNGSKNGWFSKNCINPNVGTPYDAGGTVNGVDSTTTWSHLILYQYEVPTTQDTVSLNPTLPFKRNYYE